MQLYLPHDTTCVSRYFYDSNNLQGYKAHCNKILKHRYELASHLDTFSSYGDESEEEHIKQESESESGHDT